MKNMSNPPFVLEMSASALSKINTSKTFGSPQSWGREGTIHMVSRASKGNAKS